MPIPLQLLTRKTLGDGLLPHCDSRSLFAARFADPASREGERKQWFNALIGKAAATDYPNTDWLPEDACVVNARLMSRLMVNLAGGVMENANLCLDRYGLPLIPGSAVKGCARRMALQALHDWVVTPNTPADPTQPCREGHNSPAALLAAIARIFGWTPEDWSLHQKDGLFSSDFAWAANGNSQIINDARNLLPPHETCGGTIAFLSASPNKDPRLELDVVTPHHTAYYEGDNPGAPDTEDPVPVYFPAVKAQPANQYFTFPLIPLARASGGDLESATTFFSLGLELLGLGAKTHSGYGWFEILAAQAVPQNHGDYSNEEVFTNSVIKLLNQPGQYDKLKQEVENLKKSDNSKWLEKLKTGLQGDEMKKTRKSLREKDWFPNEWLEKPTQ